MHAKALRLSSRCHVFGWQPAGSLRALTPLYGSSSGSELGEKGKQRSLWPFGTSCSSSSAARTEIHYFEDASREKQRAGYSPRGETRAG